MKLFSNYKIIIILILSFSLKAETVSRWIYIGEADYKVGVNNYYKLNLYLPYGAKDLDDVREFLYPMKFELVWQEPKLSSTAVSMVFRNQIKDHFEDMESYKLNKTSIAWFLKKLPPIEMEDKWVFEYYPDQGIRLFIDDKQIHLLIGARLNRALLNSWMDYNPFITSKLLTKLLRIQQ